ncbi:hypothetical protein EDD96_4334 [Streptomyces sp. Ag109_G2-6]|uniref:hypothetical protein n=1 Tax=Streptomyces TaxID=1883 RepID=UPI0009A4B1BD|nr:MULTISPECIES: hypothetical protein [Streptomyces]RPF40566.1 hypothetical protein EDD96_4334 [Streptomyces sp. Ag109_G2-6]
MDIEKPRAPQGGDGCLTGVVRVPVKVVAVLVVLPVRMVWDLGAACARAAGRHVLAPLGNGLGWLLVRLWRYAVRPLGAAVLYWPWVGLWRYAVAPAGSAAYRYLLRPLGLGAAWVVLACGRYVLAPVGAGLGWVLRDLVAPPLAWLYRRVLTPFGHGVRWLLRGACLLVFVWPWTGLWRYAVLPLGRGAAWVVVHVLVPPLVLLVRNVLAPAWHLAGRITRALGRGLRWLWRGCVARPLARFRRQVLTPVGHALRQVWRAARAAVGEARAEVRRALFGGGASPS